MKLCTVQNLTIAVREILMNNFIYVEKNQMKGTIGTILSQYYGMSSENKYVHQPMPATNSCTNRLFVSVCAH